MLRFLAGISAITVLLAADPAYAGDPLYDGEQLIREGRYEEALQLLLPLYMSDPAAPLAHAIARAYDGNRDDPRALRFYTQSMRIKGLSRKGRKHAKRRIRVIKKRLRNRPRKAQLSVRSSADGALVRMNGQELGRTPLSGVLIPPGSHTIKVEHDSWEPWVKTIRVQPFDQVHLDAKLIDRPTDVLVHTDPAGATARMVNGQQCVTPCLFSLRGGTYQITVQRKGFRPLLHEFVKPPGQLLELRLRMVQLGAGPVAIQGYLQVNVDRAGADIAIDGRPVARSPIPQPLAIPPGAHRITVGLAGFQPWTRDVNVTAAQTTTLTAQLIPAGGATRPQPVPVHQPAPVHQPQPTPQTWPQPTPTPTPIRVNTNPTPIRRPIQQPPPVVDGPPGQRPYGGAGLGLIIAGGVLTVGGAVGGIMLALLDQRSFNTAVRFKIENELYVSGLTRVDVIALEKSANLKWNIGLATTGVGLAVLATGIALYSVIDEGPDRLRPPSLGVAPMLGPGLVGASAQWSF